MIKEELVESNYEVLQCGEKLTELHVEIVVEEFKLSGLRDTSFSFFKDNLYF